MTSSPDLRALGVEVARRRLAAGMSIDRLAEAAAIHRRTIIQIEAGRTAPRVTTLYAIAEATGTPLRDLLAPLDEALEQGH
ncbi:helix-turn-helix transcriptional regulator [Micrococcus luteus]|uniref:helix-turn-helix transcriptional regulator n=1 Tax=Micrococcus luteus TaxID=1270 RepID=UPI003D3393F5